MLIFSSLLAFATGIILSTQNNFWVILLTAIIGVISPSGNDIGPFMAIEISALSEVVSAEDRVRVLAWYNLFGSFSIALGALFCGFLIDILHAYFHVSIADAYRVAMILYSTLQLCNVYGFYSLGPDIEVPHAVGKVVNPVSLFLGMHKSKSIVIQLSLLFMIDSFAGQFVVQSIVSAWFVLSFSTPASTVGTVLFFCNLVAGVSSLFAAKLAEQIGLIMTMVVTHVPSNILLILVPLMPNAPLAMLMIIARFSISQMDVPTRNAYVSGVVDADERSAANGVTNIARSLGGSLAPIFAGNLLGSAASRNDIFYIAGGLKLIYDFLLLISFNSVETTEEKAKRELTTQNSEALAILPKSGGSFQNNR
jgi:MFS family permease